MRACRYSNNFFSCLNSYSLILSMISTPLVFFLSFFYLYLNQVTCIIFFSLLQICNSNNVQINPPRHLSGHLSRISVTFGMLQGIAYTSQKLPLSGALQTLKTNSKLIKDQLSGLRQFLATESPFKMMTNAFYFNNCNETRTHSHLLCK